MHKFTCQNFDQCGWGVTKSVIKVLGHICICEALFESYMPKPSPHVTTEEVLLIYSYSVGYPESVFNDLRSLRLSGESWKKLNLKLIEAFGNIKKNPKIYETGKKQFWNLQSKKKRNFKKLHLWFRNFLTNWKQRVQICGSYSEWSPVISGVPQGSILGPIMFLIYVNDIPNIITSTAKLVADDTKIYRQINKVEDSIAFQSDLTTLDLWADRWQVKFNPSKREVMRNHS